MEDKSEMKGGKEEKDSSSSANGDSQDSAKQDYSATTEDPINDPVRVLQYSQPFFVADTLEEDESLIIPPTQEDSVPFMIPSTPTCADKSERKSGQLDPNESTISVLEETCIDLENKTEHNDIGKKEDHKMNTACNESDLTQDLSELDTQPIIPDTQPIIPFRDDEEDAPKEENNSTKRELSHLTVEEDDDDEWQLKFSETQTQEMLQFDKDEEENKDAEAKEDSSSKEPEKEEQKDEDSLPETCTINLEDTAKLEDKNSSSSSSVKIIDGKENTDGMESDDEIEPSQSCLSEYKGETISTTFKISSSTEAQGSDESVEEIPKALSESESSRENSTNDVQIIEDSNEKDDVAIVSESESKGIPDVESKDIEQKSISGKKTPDEDLKKVEIAEKHTESVSDSNGLLGKPEDKETEGIHVIEEECAQEPKEKTLRKANEEMAIDEGTSDKHAEEIEPVEKSKEGTIKEMEIGKEGKTKEKEKNSDSLKLAEENVSEMKPSESVTELKPGDNVSELKTNENITESKPDDSVIELKPDESKPEESKIDENIKEAKVTEHVPKLPVEEKFRAAAEMTEVNEGVKVSKNKENDKAKKSKTDAAVKSESIKTVGIGEKDELVKQDENKNTENGLEKPETEVTKAVKSNLDVKTDSKKCKTVQISVETVEPEPVTKFSAKSKSSVTKVTKSDSDSSKASSEEIQSDKKQIVEDVAETPPTSMLPPKSPWRGFGSTRKQKIENKHIFTSPVEKYEKPNLSMGVYKNIKTLEKCLKSIGITLDHERLEMILSKPEEEITIRNTITLVDHQMILKEYSIEVEHHHRETGISPISSSSTTTSSSLSLKASIHSGEMADISTTSSSGKSNSCGIQLESGLLSSQEGADNYPKTSTQKSQEPTGFSEVFGAKEALETKKTDPSPIKPNQAAKAGAAKRKRGKKNNESSSSETSSAAEPKRKRGRATKTKQPLEEKIEESDESKDAITEVKPTKASRRKKAVATVPEKIPEDNKDIKVDFEMPNDDDSGQDDGNFGSILPGVKVMARWKDGYYYSGMVQSQELDGKWAVLFEDGFLRTIAPENLIRIATLPKGTSVLVQSPDDYYDPGIVCGHYREGNKFGYEVELDNGVTKRYPRSAVILSGDQAKLITSNRPPTTPASMTINLDNIIDGKRKRKSVQSPVTSPVVKKSPRITRSKKPDSNLDSTADSRDSSAVETVNFKEPETEMEEDPVAKKRKPRKGTKAVAAAAANDSNSSNGKRTTKILPKSNKKNRGNAK